MSNSGAKRLILEVVYVIFLFSLFKTLPAEAKFSSDAMITLIFKVKIM
jgi:hypothetical protein